MESFVGLSGLGIMENIPPNKNALEEALSLSGEILRNLEMSEIPLSNIALKASRLARLLNDHESQKIMECEVNGYPSTPDGITREIYRLAVAGGREFRRKDSQTAELKKCVYTQSIEELEYETRLAEKVLDAARERDVSARPANPQETVLAPPGNWYERKQIRDSAKLCSKRLSSRRAMIYQYVLHKHYELKFSEIADDIFSRIRGRIDSAIGSVVPDAVNQLSAVYENLRSKDPQDWSNAVLVCRRILQEVADDVFPPAPDRIVEVGGQQKKIRLGKDNYKNRILAYVQGNSTSEHFQMIGSQFRFLGERLDSVFQSAQNGSQDVLVSREEADRYVILTYLLVGDVLSLRAKTAQDPEIEFDS